MRADVVTVPVPYTIRKLFGQAIHIDETLTNITLRRTVSVSSFIYRNHIMYRCIEMEALAETICIRGLVESFSIPKQLSWCRFSHFQFYSTTELIGIHNKIKHSYTQREDRWTHASKFRP